MSYRSFDEVELPVGAVTEAAPGARLDYARFASDAVLAFHRRQVDEIRPRSPGRPITHNDMGFFADLDAHALGRDLDAITWDSYPLGMLEESPLPDEVKPRSRARATRT
jgi:beta-galactosidase